MSDTRVIMAGATGMVGSIALGLCLESADVSEVTVIGRRPAGIAHPRLREVIHPYFSDFTAIADVFADQDLALFCVGAYTGTLPDEAFRVVTVNLTLVFAETLHRMSPQATFCFLSGQGADPSEKSRVAFARYKGMAENALLAVGFPRVHIFRPGYIYPVTKRKEPNWMYTVTRWLYPLLRRIYPNIGISSEDLARAMVNVGLNASGPSDPVLENRDIRLLVAHDPPLSHPPAPDTPGPGPQASDRYRASPDMLGRRRQ